jgi:hypothetical protein
MTLGQLRKGFQYSVSEMTSTSCGSLTGQGRGTIFDPFGGAKPRLLRPGKEASLRVNPEQARAFRPGSRRVDFIRLWGHDSSHEEKAISLVYYHLHISLSLVRVRPAQDDRTRYG